MFIVFWFFFLQAVPLYSQTVWQNFLIPASQEEEIEALLEQKNLPYLSWHNAQIEISNLKDLEIILVKNLKSRLDPLDPRWDPFLRSLPSLFLYKIGWNEIHRVWYRASDKKQVAALLEWVLDKPDISLMMIFSSLTWLFFLFWIWHWGPRPLIGRLSLCLCSVSLLFMPLPYIFWAGLFFATRHLGLLLSARAVAIAMQNRPPKIKVWDFFYFVLLLGLIMVLTLIKWILPQEALLGMASMFLSAGGLVIYYRLRLRALQELEHRLFLPVSLQKSNKFVELRAFFGKKIHFGLGALGTGMILLNLAFLNHKPALQSENEFPLLLAESYFQHCWFQEGIPFGVAWDDYTEGATRVLPSFLKRNEKIVKADLILETLNDLWREKLWNSLPRTHVAQLLVRRTIDENKSSR